MQLLSWKSFLLRWLVLLVAATVASTVTFLVCQWLMPPVLAWVGTRATSAGGPDLVQRLNDFGPTGVFGLVFLGVVGLGRGWAEAGRPRRQDHQPVPVPGQVVFGAIPRQAWCFQPRPVQQTGLRQALTAGSGKAALVALPGARGVGKSQLAAVYAHECADVGYELVAWINAESGLVTGLAQLAEQLGLGGGDETPERLAGRVRSVLQRRDGVRRLIVFDNVEDPIEMAGVLPTVGSAEVIITSNRQEFSTMAGITSIPVESYTPEQGRAFLAEATGLPDEADAAETGHELGWLPLGLTQAAAYIRHNRLSYPQYRTALTTQDLDETLIQQAGADHPGVLKVTALSLAGLYRGDPTGLSARLLTTLSVLSTDGVSRVLLTGEAARTALHTDTSSVVRVLRTLADASLLTISFGPGRPYGGRDLAVIAVHRLTARAVRHLADRSASMPLAEAITAATELVEMLTDSLPLSQVAYRRTELDELIAHILAVSDCARDPQPRLLKLSDWAGEALLETGDLARATPILQATLADRERVLGGDHADTLISRSNLAYAYQTADRLDEAITLYEDTLADQEQVLGGDDPDTLLSRNNLAYAYQTAGRLDEAITLFEANLTDRERVLGSDHRDTLFSRSNLAGAYLSAGRLDEAITLFEATLTDRKRVLGGDHPHTLDSRSKLAGAYESANRLDEAISLYQTTLADCERVLSADHPSTMKVRSRLDQALSARGSGS